MATPTPHQSGGPTAASQAGSTPTSVPASSMTQNGFNQNVSPMPNFSFNQMSKVIPSKLTILIGRSNHESSIFYIWICVGSICVGNSDISNNQGVLRHVTQIEKRRRIFGEILSRDICISYLTHFRQTMRLFPQTLENPVQAQVQHCQKEHRQLIKFKIIPNITHNKPNICNQYRKCNNLWRHIWSIT